MGSGITVVVVVELVDSEVEEVSAMVLWVVVVVEAVVEDEDGPTEVMSDQFSVVVEGITSTFSVEVARVSSVVEDDEDGGEGENVVGVPVLMMIGIRQ